MIDTPTSTNSTVGTEGARIMGRKVTTRKTAEQRRAEAAKLQQTIAEQVDALRTTKKWPTSSLSPPSSTPTA